MTIAHAAFAFAVRFAATVLVVAVVVVATAADSNLMR